MIDGCNCRVSQTGSPAPHKKDAGRHSWKESRLSKFDRSVRHSVLIQELKTCTTTIFALSHWQQLAC